VSAAVAGCGFRVFESALSSGGVVKAIRVPDGKRISNSRLKPPKGDVVAEATAAGEGWGQRYCTAGTHVLTVRLHIWHMHGCKHVHALCMCITEGR
jgi:hypothetical protein